MKSSSVDIPVWKKDLMARLRAQNKCTGNQALTVCGRQSPPYQSDSSGRAPKHQTSVGIRPTACNQLSVSRPAINPDKNETSDKFVSPLTLRKAKQSKMVQERVCSGEYNSWESGNNVCENDNNSRTSDSDSSEELHYGPGIVNKLKNKYLSLTLHRENSGKRQNLRKTASLEDLLDGDDDESVKTKECRLFQTNGTEKPNRYRQTKRGLQDMKRARSMEAISRFENMISPPPPLPQDNARPKSMHEYLLIADLEEGNDKYRKPKDKIGENDGGLFNNYVPRVNRPKRIAPMMNEREKPPADVVKQAKMIFEKRPEQRTKAPLSTGEVAAKVASYKNIIVQTKQAKKSPVKTKLTTPFLAKNGDNVSKHIKPDDNKLKPETKPKPKAVTNGTNSAPPKIVPRVRPTSKKPQSPPVSPSEENKAVKDEKTVEVPDKTDKVDASKPSELPGLIPDVSIVKPEHDKGRLCHTPDLIMTINPIAVSTPSNELQNSEEQPQSVILNSENSQDSKSAVPVSEPLIINCSSVAEEPLRISQISPIPRKKIVSPPIRLQKDPVLEKNLINAAKSLEQSKAEEKTDLFVPKKVRRPHREPESNSIVFKFTDRKDVPDYVQNDRSRSVGKLERPKVSFSVNFQLRNYLRSVNKLNYHVIVTFSILINHPHLKSVREKQNMAFRIRDKHIV